MNYINQRKSYYENKLNIEKNYYLGIIIINLGGYYLYKK